MFSRDVQWVLALQVRRDYKPLVQSWRSSLLLEDLMQVQEPLEDQGKIAEY